MVCLILKYCITHVYKKNVPDDRDGMTSTTQIGITTQLLGFYRKPDGNFINCFSGVGRKAIGSEAFHLLASFSGTLYFSQPLHQFCLLSCNAGKFPGGLTILIYYTFSAVSSVADRNRFIAQKCVLAWAFQHRSIFKPLTVTRLLTEKYMQCRKQPLYCNQYAVRVSVYCSSLFIGYPAFPVKIRINHIPPFNCVP